MKRILILLLIAGLISFGTVNVAFANPSPNGPGQPGAIALGQPGYPGTTCGSTGAENSPSGQSTAGFANAGAHCAGSPGTPSLEHANSPHAISQYDISCYQVTQHGLFG